MRLAAISFILIFCLAAFGQNAAQSCDVHVWAERDHFKEANAKLLEQKADRRVVLLGGSMLAGWELAKSFPDKDYVNRSIAGQGTAQLLLRFTQDVAQLRPRAVVIVPGIDDLGRGVAVADIQQNMILIAQLAKAHNIRVLYASLPALDPKGSNPLASEVKQEKLRELNKWMFLYAKDHADTYVDFWSPLGDSKAVLKKEFSADGVTLNEAALKELAPVMEKRLAEAIAGPVGKVSVKGD